MINDRNSKNNIDKLHIPELEGQYVFYFIGDHNDRSNIHDLIRAFNLEFTSQDDAILLLSTSIQGMHPQQAQHTIYEEIKSIKQTMRIHGNLETYPREIIMTHNVIDDQILSLHKACNCFVSASHGESISIPALYAV